jgi:hypothetical protein
MASFRSLSHESRADFLVGLAKAKVDKRNAAEALTKANKAALLAGCPNFRLNQHLFDGRMDDPERFFAGLAERFSSNS